MYILDTNILNILLYPSPARERVRRKINIVGQESVWFSIVTIHEKFFNGYLPAISKSLNTPNEVRQFEDARILLQKICDWQVAEFTDADYQNFKTIYGLVRKAPLDCRIAATAYRRGWTAVTHDKADFDVIKKRVPDIKIEDWSINSQA